MKRGTRLVGAAAVVVLLAGAAGFAGSAFAANETPGDATQASTVAQEQVDSGTVPCLPAHDDIDAMRAHIDGVHGTGSFDEMWSHMGAVEGVPTFDAMHASSGGVMGRWTGQ